MLQNIHALDRMWNKRSVLMSMLSEGKNVNVACAGEVVRLYRTVNGSSMPHGL